MSSAIVTVAVGATAEKVLLVLAALLIGSSVGLLGALLFGFVTAERARRPVVRMQAPAVALAAAPAADAVPGTAPPGPFDGPALGSMPALFAVDRDHVRDRHRELYDAEYAKQLDHVATLRRTIGTRMAVGGELIKPSEESDA